MNQISTLNDPAEVDTPLNKPNQISQQVLSIYALRFKIKMRDHYSSETNFESDSLFSDHIIFYLFL